MSRPVQATYYDGVTSRPQEVSVDVREPNTLEVLLPDGDRILWPMEHTGMEWERTASMLRLAFGDHPRRVVIIRDPLFIESFARRMRYTGRQGIYDRLLAAGRKGPVRLFLAAVLLLVAGYIWVLPKMAEALVMVLPRSLDRRIGEAAYTSMAASLDEDTARTVALQAFGDALHLSDEDRLVFHVVEDEQVNAFALPGGHIVVFTGILDRMDHPGELAALLAHEGTHVAERHSTRMMARGMAGYLFISLLLGDANAVVAVVADNANELRNMSYGRGLEGEADAAGQQRLMANGVDPHAMVDLLRLLEAEAADMPEELAFLSSHPLTKDRIADAETKARELGAPSVPPPALDSLFAVLKAR